MGEHRNILPITNRNGYYKKSLMDKLRDSYYERDHDPGVSKVADGAATAYFWFIALSEVYVVTEHVIPYHFSEYEPMGRYYLKVVCWFVFINSIANWMCTRFYQSFHLKTKDRPDITKSLWDAYPDGAAENALTYDSKDHRMTSWKWCVKCQLNRPPRCHHCIVCDKCVLKRDHHCYMSGVCIGFNNQRFFIILNFYIAVGSFVGLYYIWGYMVDTFLPLTAYWELILPVTIYNWLWEGTVSLHHLLMMFHLYTLWWTGFTAVGFFVWQLFVIALGKTSHEVRQSKKHIRSTNSVSENFRSVFGAFWALNFIFPANIIFRQTGDGKSWDGIKGL